jgi:hypothetical protein
VRILGFAFDCLASVVRLGRSLALCGSALVLAFATAHAQTGSGVPAAGWSMQDDELVWTSAAPLRMGGARYEFRSGARLLGFPRQHGDSLRLRVGPDVPRSELSVWAAGRRIDAAAPRARIQAPAPPAESAMAATSVDAALPGPYAIERLSYTRAGLAIDGYDFRIEVLAEVTAPKQIDAPLPVVLFLHGRHSTCYRGGPDGEPSGDWPCPPGWRAVPSHTGYRYITDVLASQGYLTVSISANGINAQDGLNLDGGAAARSVLIRHHLALWARWNATGGDPWGGRFRGRVDLQRLALVGHSRGGEGVERATIDSAADDPWRIRGLVLIGPTAFGRQVAPGVHTTVLLPFCDGDVTDLQGQQYVDIGRSLTADRALRSSVMAMGTNHNFYNTEWTPGLSESPAWDDWFDPADAQCGETRGRRLTAAEQQTVGLAYTAALVSLAVADDLTALPLLDGSAVKPASIGRAITHVHAVGGDKRLVYSAGTGASVLGRALLTKECPGYISAGPFDLRAGCTPDLQFEVLPHWSPMSFAETAPAPRALAVSWQSAGGAVRIPVKKNLRGADALDFRIAAVPNSAPIAFAVRVRDSSGAWTELPRRTLTLRSYWGPSPLGKIVAKQLRASLRESRVDPASINAIEIAPLTTAGRFWLLDVSTWRGSLSVSDPIHLPKASVGDVVVREGDFGEVEVDVPITIEGDVEKRATLWVQLTDYSDFEQPTRGLPLVIEPGAKSATVPLRFRADDAYDPFPQLTQVVLLARRNVVTGDFDGTVLVEEDDPAPQLSAGSANVTASEGSSLTWTFRLSAPLVNGGFWTLQFMSPGGRFAELDTNDVPRSFLDMYGVVPPDPAVPLSELGIFLGLEFAPGQTEAQLELPTLGDGVGEPAEGVVVVLDGFGDPVVPLPIELTGVVPAH